MNKIWCFRTEAMTTQFELSIAADGGLDENYAASAADAVFAEIHRMEEELSRFRPSSDIWRLSRLKAGESATVGFAAWDCLTLAKAVSEETRGAFDITVGPLMRTWCNPDRTPRQPTPEELEWARHRVGMHRFDLDAETMRVTVHVDEMILDLGAVGKGYALDQAITVLEDWSIRAALLNAGDSTILAHGSPEGEEGWTVTLAGTHEVKLHGRAVSGSGFEVKGTHIMNPRTMRPLPLRREITFAIAPTAALSDALSTAFTVMGAEEIAAFCASHPEIEMVVV
jgi:thiamine biosynthesis lipoprotein